jgi:hypothetical protein
VQKKKKNSLSLLLLSSKDGFHGMGAVGHAKSIRSACITVGSERTPESGFDSDTEAKCGIHPILSFLNHLLIRFQTELIINTFAARFPEFLLSWYNFSRGTISRTCIIK